MRDDEYSRPNREFSPAGQEISSPGHEWNAPPWEGGGVPAEVEGSDGEYHQGNASVGKGHKKRRRLRPAMLAAVAVTAVIAFTPAKSPQYPVPVGMTTKPAQGEGTASTPSAEIPTATESVSAVETPEPVLEFPDKPVVNEADTLYSGKYHSMDWLVSKDGLLVVTGLWETNDEWSTLWNEMVNEIQMGTGDESFSVWNITSAYVDVRNVTHLYDMFSWFYNLRSVDLSHLDTSSVWRMDGMFRACISLETADLSNFDTRNVQLMNQMFSGCESLTTVDLSSFDLRNVIEIGNMFGECNSLITLDISNFDASNVQFFALMFINCSSLTNIIISNFNTSNVKSMHGMFYGCSSLTSLDLSNFDTGSITNMDGMFGVCSKLTTIYVGSNWAVPENSEWMFYGCNTDHVTLKK